MIALGALRRQNKTIDNLFLDDASDWATNGSTSRSFSISSAPSTQRLSSQFSLREPRYPNPAHDGAMFPWGLYASVPWIRARKRDRLLFRERRRDYLSYDDYENDDDFDYTGDWEVFDERPRFYERRKRRARPMPIGRHEHHFYNGDMKSYRALRNDHRGDTGDSCHDSYYSVYSPNLDEWEYFPEERVVRLRAKDNGNDKKEKHVRFAFAPGSETYKKIYGGDQDTDDIDWSDEAEGERSRYKLTYETGLPPSSDLYLELSGSKPRARFPSAD